jgi:NTP pyrophosphatase (non-canonical NTP hydrolase)
MTITELVAAAYANAKNKGFHDVAMNIPEKLMLVVSELSEALEELREGHPVHAVDYCQDDIAHGQPPLGFPIELADAVIRIADLCGALGIDLEAAIRMKHEFNLKRPRKHGKVF